MNVFTPAPVQVHTSKDGISLYKVARVDGRAIGSAFLFGHREGYPEHQQWARAFLGGVRVAPLVVGVRS
jgi:hypothetical protein